MKSRLLVLFGASILLLTITFFASTSYGADNGSTPKGKPFVEIQGQFVEVQNSMLSLQEQLDNLVAKVDTLEGRVVANEDAMDFLNAQNAALAVLVGELIAQSAANSAEIESALAQIEDLQGQIVSLQAQGAINTAAIQDFENQIALLRDFISENTEGLQTLLAQMENNQALIEALEVQISEINVELAHKQSFLQGECPAGSSLRLIRPDGSIECESTTVDGSSGSGLRSIDIENIFTIPAKIHEWYWGTCYEYSYPYSPYSCWRERIIQPIITSTLSCPDGAALVSGGYYAGYHVSIMASHPEGESWTVTTKSTAYYETSLFVYAKCIQLIP